MNDRDPGPTPQQQTLPGVLPPGDTAPAATLRLPMIVRDLVQQVPPELRPAEARERVAAWLTTRHAVFGFQPETVYKRFAYELTRVRYELLPTCVRRFVPQGLERGLALKPRVVRAENVIDPLAVLHEAYADANAYPGRRRFEAERDLALAYLALWLVTDAELTGVKDRQRWREDRKSAKDRNMFMDHLRRAGVLAGPTNSVKPIVTLDRAPPHRCLTMTVRGHREFVCGDPTSPGIHPKVSDVDLIGLDTSDGRIPAFFLPRRKGILQTIAKMLLARLDTPLSVPDRRGVRFAYRNEEELQAGAAFVGRKVCLGLVRKTHLENEAAPVNPYAAPNLLIIKDSAAFHDSTIEVQHLLARQHIDVQYSRGPEHYLLYHRRQYTAPDGLFTELFPTVIYRTDWLLPYAQLQMDEHIRSSFAL